MMDSGSSNGQIKEKLISPDARSVTSSKFSKDSFLPAEEEFEVSTKATRFSAFLRSIYAEFLGSTMLFIVVYGVNANYIVKNYSSDMKEIINAFGSGFQVLTLIFCFSSLSGAQFNPAITFALWLVGKVSNRKCIFFILTQMLASVFAMILLYAMYPDIDYDILNATVSKGPGNASSANIFFSEFILTGFLTYTAFAMAFEEAQYINPSKMTVQSYEDESVIMYQTTPQSKAGFAPFAIGFTVLVLTFVGGGSGAGMNPARVFGPILFSNEWSNFYLYILGEFSGAGAAALLVHYGPHASKRTVPVKKDISVVASPRKNTIKGNDYNFSSDSATGVTELPSKQYESNDNKV
jgi:glycerol uptake facilitator-like aquaporin